MIPYKGDSREDNLDVISPGEDGHIKLAAMSEGCCKGGGQDGKEQESRTTEQEVGIKGAGGTSTTDNTAFGRRGKFQTYGGSVCQTYTDEIGAERQ